MAEGQRFRVVDLILGSGQTHTLTALEGRDTLALNIEHGKIFFIERNDAGGEREKQTINLDHVAILKERVFVKPAKPLPPPSDGPAKVVEFERTGQSAETGA